MADEGIATVRWARDALARLVRLPTPIPHPAINRAYPIFGAFARSAPVADSFVARDGTPLHFRRYLPERCTAVAVVLHGSSGTGIAAHGIASALAAAGIAAYAPDLRGHGGSGRLGDVGYVGQYDDDLSDLVQLIAREYPGLPRLLTGHSMGGAIVLRIAAGAGAKDYDAFLALAPLISSTRPLSRPDLGGWRRVSRTRLASAHLFRKVGIRAMDHVPILSMAVARNDHGRPAHYTYAQSISASLPSPWGQTLRRIGKPATVLIGADDELFLAEAYPPALARHAPQINVCLIAEVGHMDLLYRPCAVRSVVAEALDLLAPDRAERRPDGA